MIMSVMKSFALLILPEGTLYQPTAGVKRTRSGVLSEIFVDTLTDRVWTFAELLSKIGH